MSERALVLVARPTPAGVDERSLAALAAAVAARTPGPVRTAHLDQAEPSLHDALDDLVAAGSRDVLLVPLAVPDDRYLRTWVSRALANWRETRPGPHPAVRTAAGLTGLPALVDAVAGLVGEPGAEVTASPVAFRSPSWSELDVPDRHLLVCRGPRCTVHGAGATHRALADAARGSVDAGTTQVSPTGCLGPCNLGPLVVEHPGAVWHRHVDADRATELGRGNAGRPADDDHGKRGGERRFR